MTEHLFDRWDGATCARFRALLRAAQPPGKSKGLEESQFDASLIPVPPDPSLHPSLSEQDTSPRWIRPHDWEVCGKQVFEWVCMARFLGPLATRALLEIMESPSELVPVTPWEELETPINAMIAREGRRVGKTQEITGKDLARKEGRNKPSLETPMFQKIDKAFNKIAYLARLSHPFVAESAHDGNGEATIWVGNAWRVRKKPGSAPVAEIINPCTGEWEPTSQEGWHERDREALRMEGLTPPELKVYVNSASFNNICTPIMWPLLSANNSSSASRIDRVMRFLVETLIHKARCLNKAFDADWQNMEEEDKVEETKMNWLLKAPTKGALEGRSIFKREAYRVSVVNKKIWHQRLRKSHANRGHAVKVWWDEFVDREVLSAAVKVVGTSKERPWRWEDQVALQRHPQVDEIIEAVKHMKTEGRWLREVPFEAWAHATPEKLVDKKPWSPAWLPLWDEVRKAPATVQSQIVSLLEKVDADIETLKEAMLTHPSSWPPAEHRGGCARLKRYTQEVLANMFTLGNRSLPPRRQLMRWCDEPILIRSIGWLLGDGVPQSSLAQQEESPDRPVALIQKSHCLAYTEMNKVGLWQDLLTMDDEYVRRLRAPDEARFRRAALWLTTALDEVSEAWCNSHPEALRKWSHRYISKWRDDLERSGIIKAAARASQRWHDEGYDGEVFRLSDFPTPASPDAIGAYMQKKDLLQIRAKAEALVRSETPKVRSVKPSSSRRF